MKIYIDGTIHDKETAKVSVLDHGLMYGDGVFEGIRIYAGKVYKLEEHLDRLYDSAKAIALALPLGKEAMEKAVLDTVAASGRGDGYIRLIVTRGEGPLGLDPTQCPKPSVIIIAGDIQLYPHEYYEKGIPVVTAGSRRTPQDSLDPRVKSLNYLNNVMAKLEARQAGCLEAVMLNHEGYVVECTADNLFIVKDGRLRTPPPSLGALDGITMRTVLDLAEENDLDVRQQAFTRYDLYTADECFLTGTGAEIMPVTKVDGRPIGSGEPGPVTRMLMDAFHKTVRGEA